MTVNCDELHENNIWSSTQNYVLFFTDVHSSVAWIHFYDSPVKFCLLAIIRALEKYRSEIRLHNRINTYTTIKLHTFLPFARINKFNFPTSTNNRGIINFPTDSQRVVFFLVGHEQPDRQEKTISRHCPENQAGDKMTAYENCNGVIDTLWMSGASRNLPHQLLIEST